MVKTPKTFYGAGAGARETPVLAKTPAAPKAEPKVTKTPKAVMGRTPKVLATRGRTPKVARPTLWSEIVARQGKVKTPKLAAVAVAERTAVTKKKAKVLSGTPKLKHRAVLNLQSTGHAASPETLVIRGGKRRSGVKVQVKEKLRPGQPRAEVPLLIHRL